MENHKILDISTKTIIKLSVTAVLFYFLFVLRDILMLLIFAVIISILFEPAIEFLRRLKAPRALAVVFIYLLLFGFFSTFVWFLVPVFSQEATQFIDYFPEYFDKISPIPRELGFKAFENLTVFLESFKGILSAMAGNIFGVLFVFFGGIFSTVFVMATSIFISLEEKATERTLLLIFPKKYEKTAMLIWERAQKKVAGWFLARIISCIFVGTACYITFLVFGIDYPLILAIISGILNFIPYLGPFITGILLFLIVFPSEIIKFIFVILSFTLIQQIENHILSPILMKRIVNIPPVLVIVALVVGGKLWGFLGSLLIIPLAGILFEFTNEFLKSRKAREIE